MNSINAVGFLFLGSLMNALPVLVPSLATRGLVLENQMSSSVLWLHFMGLVVALIGAVFLVREGLAYRPAMSLSRTPARVPAGRPAQIPVGLQAA